MKPLQKAIKCLEDLQESSRGSFVGNGEEILIFLRHDLQGVIDDLKDIQNDLENENDSGGGRSHE